jgi:hypothetical protein
MTRRSLPLLLLAVALTACSGDRPERPPRPQLVISPNAEPLALGDESRCKVEMVSWFARVDTNHDGFIDRNEFMADARRWFAELDQGKKGYVTAADLAAVRDRKVPLPVAAPRDPNELPPERRMLPPLRSRFDPLYDRPTDRMYGDRVYGDRYGDRMNAGEGQTGSARRDRMPTDFPERPKSGLRNGVAGEPDPVMAADTDLDFKVTVIEWELYTGSNFNLLDRNNDGRLSPDEVASHCEMPLSRR